MPVDNAHPTIAMQYGDMLEEPMLSRADTANSIRDATPLRMHAGTPEDSPPFFDIPKSNSDGETLFARRSHGSTIVKAAAGKAECPSDTVVSKADQVESFGSKTFVNYQPAEPAGSRHLKDTGTIALDNDVKKNSVDMADAPNGIGSGANDSGTPCEPSRSDRLRQHPAIADQDEADQRAVFEMLHASHKIMILPTDVMTTSSSTSDAKSGRLWCGLHWPPRKFELAVGLTAAVVIGSLVDLVLSFKNGEHFDRPVWIQTATLLIFTTMGFHHVSKKRNEPQRVVLPFNTSDIVQTAPMAPVSVTE